MSCVAVLSAPVHFPKKTFRNGRHFARPAHAECSDSIFVWRTCLRDGCRRLCLCRSPHRAAAHIQQPARSTLDRLTLIESLEAFGSHEQHPFADGKSVSVHWRYMHVAITPFDK